MWLKTGHIIFLVHTVPYSDGSSPGWPTGSSAVLTLETHSLLWKTVTLGKRKLANKWRIVAKTKRRKLFPLLSWTKQRVHLMCFLWLSWNHFHKFRVNHNLTLLYMKQVLFISKSVYIQYRNSVVLEWKLNFLTGDPKPNLSLTYVSAKSLSLIRRSKRVILKILKYLRYFSYSY